MYTTAAADAVIADDFSVSVSFGRYEIRSAFFIW
jgi:hypothetical protein